MHFKSNQPFDINCQCDSIIDFLANSYFTVQIYHAKSFKMKYIRSGAVSQFLIKIFIKTLKSMVRFNVHKTLAIYMIKWKIFKLFYLPVYKGSLGKHQIKLFIQSRPSFLNGSCIDETCYSAVNFSQVPSRDNGWWLVINPNLI